MPRITFQPENRTVEVSSGTSLLDAASKAGLEIAAPCGGEGACGECRVRVTAGRMDWVARGCLSEQELRDGWALACSSRVTEDATIRLEPARVSAVGQIVTDHIAHHHAFMRAHPEQSLEPPVKKILVKVTPPSLDNAFSDIERLEQALDVADDARVSCGLHVLRELAAVLRGAQPGLVTVSVLRDDERGDVRIIRVEPGDTTARAHGLAIDIGTTTCVAHLVDLVNDVILGTASDYNGQRARGFDIISRINYARAPGRLAELRGLVLNTVNSLVAEVCGRHDVDPAEIDNAAFAGNTTMAHLLLGLDPEYIRMEPYTPTVNCPPLLEAGEIGVNVNPHACVAFAPGVGSYVGGDITAGLLQTMLSGDDESVSLFLDFGTNGEVVLGNAEWLMACAASAGPAFEGAGIKCGMRAAAGAIERVSIDARSGKADISVIGGGKPAGVCGSGMIDLLAGLWGAGLLDPSGKLMPDAAPELIMPSPDSSRNLRYLIVPAEEAADGHPITITGQDIMNLLRAKAAVYSACSLMLHSVGLDFDAVSRVYVAGGFGRFLDLDKAVLIGMLPDMPLNHFIYLGNSALAGAHALLVSRAARRKIRELARRLTYFELNADPAYMDEYMAALFLPHTDVRRFPSAAKRLAQRR
ncbi:MAG: ASKHA domain-containing protein [bacterium]